MRMLSYVVTLVAVAAAHAAAQIRPVPIVPPLPAHRTTATFIENDDRSGPRLGVAYIAGGSVTAEQSGHPISPLTTVFGWQIEHQFPSGDTSAPLPMTELVFLAGGMEQGVFLPSVTWIAGLRQPNGWEAGVGPTLTGAGLQLAVAAGVTHHLGTLNVPVNVAIAPGRRGAAISVTTGFNRRRSD